MIIPNKKMNILVGDNEVGKSTVLEVIDLYATNDFVRRMYQQYMEEDIKERALKTVKLERNFG